MKLWELPPRNIASLSYKKYDYAIVLTGVASSIPGPNGRVHTQRGADRILDPIWLYKRNIVDTILITGGLGKVQNSPKGTPEALLLKRVLMDAGVPANRIITEEKARNTHENAAFATKIIHKNTSTSPKCLLVTSAFHMRRALACFKNEGLNPEPFAVDLYSNSRSFTPENLLLPKQEAFLKWQVMLKEITGMLAYKVSGYI